MPDRLWRLDPLMCFAPATLELSSGRKTFNLADRAARVSAYIWLLEHGAEQLLAHVDGALLVDAWPDSAPNLHADVRHAWAPLIDDGAFGWGRG